MLMKVEEKEIVATKTEVDPSMDSNNNQNNIHATTKAEEKYGLRPRTLIKRLQQEKTRQEVPKKPQRSKSRPAPLSKYRRKTANARERHRMREINNAFESLRKALPDAYETRVTNAMTKISTLKLAVQYIQALSRVLSDASDNNFYSLDNPTSHEDNIAHSCDLKLEQTGTKASNSSNTVTITSSQSCFLHSSLALSNASAISSSSSSSSRGSLSSASDLEEILSDDSALLEDNLDVFHDIQPLPGPDPFELLLDQSRENLIFSTDFCSFK